MVVKISKKIKFYIPVEQERVLSVTKIVVISLAGIALLLGILCTALALQTDRITIEAGSAFWASDVTGNESSDFGDDFDPDCINHPGVYEFTVITDGQISTVRLTVVDTLAPDVTVKRIRWPISEKLRRPIPEDFIDSVVEADGFSGRFVEELPEFKKPGVYKAKIVFEDNSGNKTQVFSVELELVSDNTNPVLTLLRDSITVPVGSDPRQVVEDVISKYVKAVDDCGGDITFEIDESALKLDEEGSCYLSVCAKDMVGNRSETVRIRIDVSASVEEVE